MHYKPALPLLLLPGLLSDCVPKKEHDWPEYYGNGARSHYAPLDQIRPENVSRLEVAWTYGYGGADTARNRSQIQCNPIIVDDVLYEVSADIQAFAIKAATGKEIWKTGLTE